jgi:hypothetical protein
VNRCGGSQAITRTFVSHCLAPLWLTPRNLAPVAGPDAAPTQRPPRFSGLYEPIRGRSLSIDHTTCASAVMSTLREIVGSTT